MDVEGIQATVIHPFCSDFLQASLLCSFLTSWLSDQVQVMEFPGLVTCYLDHPGSGARAVYSHSTAATTSRWRAGLGFDQFDQFDPDILGSQA